jgi:catechol 2,3-dioxygenase-like lactoylglutathione lyase family enzyme
MLDHVSITVSDIAAAERFYDSIMKVLGVVKVGRRGLAGLWRTGTARLSRARLHLDPERPKAR